MRDVMFLAALIGAAYTGAPKWALILSGAILLGVHMVLGAMTEVGREVDRQVAGFRSQLKELRPPPNTGIGLDDY